ncbi:receptor-like protein 35 [Quercus lobata]|uniref:receptor-like protein 35 n=1 Tax=Quercus lobata TaxID=97700 RepID=UPI001243C5A1|nr:receptor-like protein 35 [Quercus lobata]
MSNCKVAGVNVSDLDVVVPNCHAEERLALLQFKDSFMINKSASINPYPKVSSWTLNDCCSWDGVECDEHTGHVIGLDLSRSCLYGSFDSNSSLFRLLQLQKLNLAYNHFNYSQIPFRVAHFLRLAYLDLSHSVFSGRIPQSLANLSFLTDLRLDNCALYEEFPTTIFYLPNLQHLSIGDNQDITGHLPELHKVVPSRSIPPSVSNLTQLNFLDLPDNTFTENGLSGMVELDVFLKLKNLSVLMLSSNNLYVLTKTSSNDTLPQFHTLALGSCSLSKFPVFLKNQSNLIWLDLRGKNFQGLIPKWMYNVSVEALRALFLDGNFLTAFEQTPAVLPWRIVEL